LTAPHLGQYTIRHPDDENRSRPHNRCPCDDSSIILDRHHRDMAEGEEARVRRVLERAKEEYGFVPLVSEVMSDRPDLFLPYAEISSGLFFKPKHMDRKTAELAAITAGAALGSENCLGVHILQAFKIGVSEEAVLEAMILGGFMSMNRSNSISFRCLKAAKESMR